MWRGIIYALLMVLGKLVTGIWLVRFSLGSLSEQVAAWKKFFLYVNVFQRDTQRNDSSPKKINKNRPARNNRHTSIKRTENTTSNSSGEVINQEPQPPSGGGCSQIELQGSNPTATSELNSTIVLPSQPKSLYPSSILGLAMVARGEVGYLIASFAQSKGIFSNEPSGKTSEVFLVIIWAISICTLIGPITVGTLIKRVQRLQKGRAPEGAHPLGIWGI